MSSFPESDASGPLPHPWQGEPISQIHRCEHDGTRWRESSRSGR
ncbi:MAG: hypothetical protein AB7I30_21060 [Isosphaeraceae bacterium]